MFAQLVLHQGQGEARTEDARALEFRHQPGQCANVILMPVGEHDAQQPVLDGAYRAEMRNDHIHAQMGVVREHQPAIHHDHTAPCLPELAVEADFTKSPQGGYLKIGFAHECRHVCLSRRKRDALRTDLVWISAASDQDEIRPWPHKSGPGP